MSTERIYQLLPSVYRARDAAEGEPLRALLGVLEGELSAVRDSVEGLYDDWFIETCAEWVAPYLGDLVGADRLAAMVPGTDNGRGYIANTVAYHRRKGTAGGLSSLGRDLTGWPATAVEFYQLVALTQPLDHKRPRNLRTPDLRRGAELRQLGGPFEQAAHTADLRSAGKYALGNIGVFVWRLTSYPVSMVPAAPAPQTGCYHFDPLGLDTALWNPQRAGAGEPSAPAPLEHGALVDALEAARLALAAGLPAPANPYFDSQPAFQIFIDGGPVPPEEILIAHLDDWTAPPPDLPYGGVSLPIRVAVDPRLGRLALAPSPTTPSRVRVSYYRGFSSEVGGGFYDRRSTLSELPAPAPLAGGSFAVAPPAPGGRAVVEITDSLTYTPLPLHVPDNATLEIRSANKQRALLRTPPAEPWSITLGTGATLILNGLLLDAGLAITAPAPATLSLVHCTVVPGHAITDGASSRLTLTLSRCITGALTLDAGASTLSADQSVIDGAGGPAVQAGSGALSGCTVLGSAALRRLTSATDTLFCGPLTVQDPSTGALGTCFVPPGSTAPAGTRCQPALALSQAAPADRAAILARVQPAFTSVTYGKPGYAQLRRTCPVEILQGGSDQSEMGVFHHLYQPRRQQNLEAGLGAYLRFGLGVTLFFVT